MYVNIKCIQVVEGFFSVKQNDISTVTHPMKGNPFDIISTTYVIVR